MKLDCKFEKSATAIVECPRWDRREIAVAGRSNVGKSSLINALVSIKGLARTSRTPGRTQALNFFAVGVELALVDLPGYGYAKMPEALARKVSALMSDFLAQRNNLTAVLLLIDSRRGPREEEFALAEMARSRGLELVIAITKADKLRRSERAATLRRVEPLNAPIFPCSAANGEGLEPLRLRLFKISRAHGVIDPAPRRASEPPVTS
ncbi:MAG TPA: ribosome biogenesis GTP-binding protein YihA/YsxC [Candidatus Binataceae bacterium]